MFSKCLFVYLFVLFAVYNDKFANAGGNEMRSIIDACQEQYPTPDGEAEWLHFKKTGELPDESRRNSKCQFFCIPNKLGMMDDNGVLDVAKAKELFLQYHPDFTSPDKLDQVIQECRIDDASIDICDRSYGFKKCMMKRYLKAKGGR